MKLFNLQTIAAGADRRAQLIVPARDHNYTALHQSLLCPQASNRLGNGCFDRLVAYCYYGDQC